MIWTGSPGQIATTMTILAVPLTLHQSILLGFAYQGVPAGVGELVAGTITLAWVAIIATPDVREQVTLAIFPDERERKCCYQCGVHVDRCACGQEREGHDLRRVGARVRDRMSGVVGA